MVLLVFLFFSKDAHSLLEIGCSYPAKACYRGGQARHRPSSAGTARPPPWFLLQGSQQPLLWGGAGTSRRDSGAFLAHLSLLVILGTCVSSMMPSTMPWARVMASALSGLTPGGATSCGFLLLWSLLGVPSHEGELAPHIPSMGVPMCGRFSPQGAKYVVRRRRSIAIVARTGMGCVSQRESPGGTHLRPQESQQATV